MLSIAPFDHHLLAAMLTYFKKVRTPRYMLHKFFVRVGSLITSLLMLNTVVTLEGNTLQRSNGNGVDVSL